MNAHPNEQQAQDQYAAELTRRYRELRRWATDNWPNSAQPLTGSDFIASDRELQLLLGARLHPGRRPASTALPGQAQYENVTPMPWP